MRGIGAADILPKHRWNAGATGFRVFSGQGNLNVAAGFSLRQQERAVRFCVQSS
jgi:hypothetical protein